MSATPNMEEIDPNPADDPIEVLKGHVAAMSELAVGMVADGTRALLTNDAALAKSVTDRDAPLDRFDIAIETESMRLIATMQPEAGDLRTIGAVLKIANCVDRVGRLGFDLAKNLTAAPEPSDPAPAELLRKMDAQTRRMVQASIAAFMKGDADEEKGIFALDDDVDDLYDQLQDRVFQLLQKGGAASERLARYLIAGRHLERVGDNACKIAEKAIYAITGERRPEYFPALAHRVTSGVRPPGHVH
ncbi:MAG TPA: phosphate signaling complex protein PhoU [Thermoplasmata archaeon]|nr:phosphate signaling complex protein PhoU [Thermoplasmata archaeon]